MRSPQTNWGSVVIYVVSLLVVLSMICGLLSSVFEFGPGQARRTPTMPLPTATRTPPPAAITAAPGAAVPATAVPSTATPGPVGAPSPVPVPSR